MTEEMVEELVDDPDVVAAVSKAGANAFNDDKVQQVLLKKATEKFPDAAQSAGSQLKQIVKSPVVQEKAFKCAGVAMVYIGSAKGEFVKRMEQGPAGVRFLAFLGGVVSCGFGMFNCINVFSALSHTVKYVMNIYIVLFSLTVVVFEAKSEWIQKVPWILDYQDNLIQQAKFLAEVLGRGLFYMFLGTLWLSNMDVTLTSVTGWCALGLGCYMFFIGLLHVLMHWNVMPPEVVKRVRDIKSKYKGVPPPPAPEDP